MQYFYRVAQGQATLNKSDDMKIKNIGKFKSDAEAKEACENHFKKACKALENLGQPLPTKFYM